MNTVRYSVSNKQKPSTIPSRECSNCILGLGCTTLCQNIWETSKVLKLKSSNLSSISFYSSFLISQKCPTMSLHQEAIASSTSSFIWGLKEFTTMVESPSRPWSSLSCFEATPSIQVRYSNETLTLRKHVTKYKNMHKMMVEFLKKIENRDFKIALVNSIRVTKSINLLYCNFLRCLGSVVMLTF